MDLRKNKYDTFGQGMCCVSSIDDSVHDSDTAVLKEYLNPQKYSILQNVNQILLRKAQLCYVADTSEHG